MYTNHYVIIFSTRTSFRDDIIYTSSVANIYPLIWYQKIINMLLGQCLKLNKACIEY